MLYITSPELRYNWKFVPMDYLHARCFAKRDNVTKNWEKGEEKRKTLKPHCFRNKKY